MNKTSLTREKEKLNALRQILPEVFSVLQMKDLGIEFKTI
jgi:hypothetical protein